MQDFSVWYRESAPQLSGHGIWLRGDAPGMLDPAEFAKRPSRVLVCRLSSFQDTRFSFTHRLLYALYGESARVYADLAYLPPAADVERLNADGVPWWLPIASKRHPREFGWLAISNALVQELVNLPILLRGSGIPLRQSERLVAPRMPLLILGGANAVHASALWGPDPLVDGIVIGEDAASIARVRDILADAEEKGLLENAAGRLATLDALAEVPGFFRPDAVRPARKVDGPLADLNRLQLRMPWVPDPECTGVASLQISEGCPYFCSFCAESYSRKPYREQDGTSLLAHARLMKTELGLSEVELFSFNFNTHRDIEDLVVQLAPEFGSVGLKSQRFDALAGNMRLLSLMRLADKSSVTCGLEGCSDRIRSYLQKQLTQNEFRSAAAALLANPLRELKVFLIATGHENEADLAEFRSDLQWLLEELRRNPKKPRVVFSATPLVRFPWTPLEFEDALPPDECAKAVKRIKNVVVSGGFEFREAADEYECALSQILVRAKDPRILTAVSKAAESCAFVYREGVGAEMYNTLLAELARLGYTERELLAGHDPAAAVPWSLLQPGISREYLVQQYRASLEFRQTPVCLPLGDRKGGCQRCDACTPAQKKAIVGRKVVTAGPAGDLVALDQRLRAERRNDLSVSLVLDLEDRCQGLPLGTIQSLLVRALLRADAGLAPHFRRALPGPCERERDLLRWSGVRVLPLLWSREGAVRLQALLQDSGFVARVVQDLSGWLRLGTGVQVYGGEEIMAWEIISPFACEPGSYLQTAGLKHTLRKEGSGKACDFAKDALKKKILRSLQWENTTTGSTVAAVSLAKFAPVDFLRDVFVLPRSEVWAATRARVTKILQSV